MEERRLKTFFWHHVGIWNCRVCSWYDWTRECVLWIMNL